MWFCQYCLSFLEMTIEYVELDCTHDELEGIYQRVMLGK